MIDKIKKIRENIKLYTLMTDLTSTSRRYFVIGYFDGVLTILGMIIGAHLSGEASANLILSAGVATALALGISSAWGAFEAERVEQMLLKLEKKRAMLVDSQGCIIDRAHKFATYISSAVHGIAPIIAALIPLIPYTILKEDYAFIASLTIGFASLFIVGLILGKIGKCNVFLSGLRMVLAGVVTVIVISVLSPSHFR